MAYFYHNNRIRQSGIAALLIVVIIAGAVLIMAYFTALLGLGELDLGFVFQKGQEAFSLTDGCLEETLRRIKLDANYGLGAGDINLNLDNGSCIIRVEETSLEQRRVIVQGQLGDYNKKIEANVSLSGNVITLDMWQEIEN